jgi:hypothetical protein
MLLFQQLDYKMRFGLLSSWKKGINPSKPSVYCIYHLLYHAKTLHCAHRVYLCLSYGSHNKQQLYFTLHSITRLGFEAET